MRKLGIAILVIVVLVVAVALIAPRFIDVNQYRGKIQAELESHLNRPVELGPMSLKLLPPRFEVQNVTIGEDKSFNTGRPFATAQELYVSAKLLPLLHKDVEIQTLELRRPQVELVRNAQGVWNFASLGNRQVNGATTAAQPDAGKRQQPAPPQQHQEAQQPENQQQQAKTEQQNKQKFELGKLQITDGQVAITDAQKHQSRAVYDHIDLALKNFAPGEPFDIDAAAHLPGQGKQYMMLRGKGGPINDASLVQTPFDGTLKLEQVSLSAAQKFLNSAALEGTDAIISGTASLKNQSGKMASDGTLKFDQAKIKGTDVGYPIEADYNLSDDLTNDVINISKGSLKLGPTPLSISGSVNTRNNPSLLDVHVIAGNASISELARLAAAAGVAFNPNMQVNGKIDADITAKGPSDKPQLNGKLSGRNIEAQGKELPAPVKIDGIDLALTPTTIHSNEFTASSGPTALAVQFTLNQYASPQPAIDATVKTANADIANLLGMAKASGVSAAEGVTGSGKLSLDVHATGPIKDSAAMTFSGKGQLLNASIKPQDFTQPLNIKNADLQFTQNSIVLNNLQSSLGSTNANGSMTVRNFQAPQVQFMLAADKLNVVELQKITGTESAASANPPQKKVMNLSLVPAANAQAKPSAKQPSILTKTTGQGTISVGTITYDQLVLNDFKSNVHLNNGVIQLNPVTSQIAGGQENGTITLDVRGPQTLYNIALKLGNVDANKLISSVSSTKDVLYGILGANTNLSFASVPNGGDIARTLNGKASIDLKNGKLVNIDMLQQLSSIGKFTSFGRSAQNFTNVQQLSGDFDIRNGVATTNDLKAVIDGGTVAAAGNVSLVDQSINMKVTAVLSSQMASQVGGNGIGGFMQTALANNKGELVMPVLITGTLQHPQVQPDMSQIAQMKMQNLLPTLANPNQLTSGGIGGILGALAGKGNNNAQQQPNGAASNPAGQQQNPAEAIGNALGGLLGGGKQKPDNNDQPKKQKPPK